MSGIWGLSLASLTLILLSVCSTGMALKCYDCPWFSTDTCGNVTTCKSPNDVCLRVSTAAGSYYNCWESTKCDIEGIQERFKLNTFNSTCCTDNLCNDAMASLPLTSLVLSLVIAAALLTSY